jgi:signal transduction histidine kinase
MQMRLRTLYSRIVVAFALVLLAFGAALGWLAWTAAKYHQHEVMQEVYRGLAANIAARVPLGTGANAANRVALDEVLRMSTAVNPSIEVYLLDRDGVVVAQAPATAPLARTRVNLDPVRAFVAGGRLPLLGDSPRLARGQEIFSAAPLGTTDQPAGYVYVVLVGDMYRQMAEAARRDYALRTALWTGVVALALALAVGAVAFARITRPLRKLTLSVDAFDRDVSLAAIGIDRGRPLPSDEIERLAEAFERLMSRVAAQVDELKRQDALRRELVANISHDLRTPLTSMQNYLETLVRSKESLDDVERSQYLEIAVRESRRVAKLAAELFELARLECAETLPQPENFSVSELLQDVAQKFALAASDKQIALRVEQPSEVLFVRGDIAMIERVISNLLENAIRHTPARGAIMLVAERAAAGVEVRVADTGIGIAAEHLPRLFDRDSPLRANSRRAGSGLGLQIVRRILALHGSRIAVASEPGRGTTFRFSLPAASPA